jgi:hypothetical protein
MYLQYMISPYAVHLSLILSVLSHGGLSRDGTIFSVCRAGTEFYTVKAVFGTVRTNFGCCMQVLHGNKCC